MFWLLANFLDVLETHSSGGGHEAMSCDLLPTESPGPHHQGDVREILDWGWDLMIAHPPCTYLTTAAEWAYKDPSAIKKNLNPEKLYGYERLGARSDAIEFVKELAGADIEKICIENPVGVLSTQWREPDQYIHPHQYNDDASKLTCLWLKGLQRLKPTGFYPPRLVPVDGGRSYKMRWSNQTDSGQNKEPPSENRAHVRSKTYLGWADAMADQWGKVNA